MYILYTSTLKVNLLLLDTKYVEISHLEINNRLYLPKSRNKFVSRCVCQLSLQKL